MKRIKSRVLSLVLVLGMVLVPWSTGAPAVAAPEPPDLPQTYDADIEALSPEVHAKGYIAPAVDLSHLEEQYVSDAQSASLLPTMFDWRNKGGMNYVSPVRNQGACGACYAFSFLGNFESKVMIDNAATYPGSDYSENHAKECNWHELNNTTGVGSCLGGNSQMMANLFTTKGTVLESTDPYTTAFTVCNTPMGPYQTTVRDWHVISGDWVPNPLQLKQAVYNKGPVAVAVYAGNGDAWDTQFGSYAGGIPLVYSGPLTSTVNHGVLLVGWDDALTYPGGSGAWIFKNSWGTGWGSSGYGYIAYGSANFGKYTSYIENWQDYDPNSGVLYYDDAGATAGVGYNDTTAWGMNTFTVTEKTNVTHVEVWTNDVTTDVDIKLYESFNGTSPQNMLWQSNNHAFTEAGYHSVPLPTPLPVAAGGTVVAVIKVSTAVYTYPVPVDMTGPVSGNSFVSHFGTNWTPYTYDIGIRLRTTTALVNVGITKAVWGGDFGPDDPITFTLEINNSGTVPAAGVVVTDIMPSEVVSTVVDSTVTVTATGTQDYVWEVAPIGVGQTEVITVYGNLANWVLPDVSFGNEALIWDPQDQTPDNNSSRILVGAHDVFLPIVVKNYPPLQYRVFYPTGDAGIMQGFPNANTGLDMDMKVGYELDGCFGLGGAHISRGLVQFDLSTLPAHSVTKATLYVHNSSACSWQGVPNAPVTAYRITDHWNEGTVTWNNGPGFDESYGTVLIPLGSGYESAWREIDVTGLVNAWLHGVPNHGVMLRGHEANDAISAMVKLLQHDGTGLGPWLSVNYYGPSQ